MYRGCLTLHYVSIAKTPQRRPWGQFRGSPLLKKGEAFGVPQGEGFGDAFVDTDLMMSPKASPKASPKGHP